MMFDEIYIQEMQGMPYETGRDGVDCILAYQASDETLHWETEQRCRRRRECVT